MNLRPLITRPNLTARRGFAIAVALLAAGSGSAGAQRLAPAFAASEFPVVASRSSTDAALARFGHPDDHRWEGALVGAIAVGVLGAIVGYGMCHFDNPDPPGGCVLPTFFGLVIGVASGGGAGGLVGGLIPKEKK